MERAVSFFEEAPLLTKMKIKIVDVWTKLDCSGAVITNLISQVLTVVSAYKTFLKFSFSSSEDSFSFMFFLMDTF